MPRAARPALIALFLALGTACTSDAEPVSDFVLRLVPRTPLNQDLFASAEPVTVVVREGRDSQKLYYLGDMADGEEVRGGGFGPLSDAMIGVLVQEMGADPAQYEPSQLIAYGEAGPFTLALGAEEVEANLFLSGYASVGDLDLLPDDTPAFRSAAAMTSDGSVYLFGGANRLTGAGTAVGHAYVQRLAPLDDGDWQFDVVAEMPDFDEDGYPDTVIGATAVPVQVDEKELIFVAGGRPKTYPFSGNSYNTAFFDPGTNAFTWVDDDLVGSRSEHESTLLPNGNVLLFGGMTGSGFVSTATWEIFDPARKSSQSIAQTIDTSAAGFALASLGNDGVLVCGGARFASDGNGQYSDPQEQCYRITLSGDAVEEAPLPVALQLHAMAPLADGRVLVCGGLTERAYDQDESPASARAWLWDPGADTWTEVGSMSYGRTTHRAIPTPDGKIVVLGGASYGGYASPSVGEPVECPEIFDPATLAFSVVEPCSAAGAGYLPTVAYDPDHYAVVVSGIDATRGGYDYGAIAFGPPF